MSSGTALALPGLGDREKSPIGAGGRISGAFLTRLHIACYGAIAPWMRQCYVTFCRSQVSELLVSAGRGSAKTGVAGVIAAGLFIGECARGSGRDVVIVGPSRGQATTCARDARRVLDNPRLRHRDDSNAFEIEDRVTGARIRVLAPEPARLQGLRLAGAVCEEVSSWPARTSAEMRAAVAYAAGKDGPSKTFWISTQHEDAGHWFNVELESPSKGRAAMLFAAQPGRDVQDPKGWHEALPSLRTLNLPDVEVLTTQAAQAAGSAREEAAFRKYRLNEKGIKLDADDQLIAADVWAGLPPGNHNDRRGPYVLGCDVGGGRSATAVAACWPLTMTLQVLACYGRIPPPEQRERDMGLEDGRLRRMAEAGDLMFTDGRSPSLAPLLREVESRWGRPETVLYDSYRSDDLNDAVDAVGWFGAQRIARRPGERISDLARFLTAVEGGRVRPIRSELLDLAVSHARGKAAPGGQTAMVHQPDKLDDPVSAAGLAVASALRTGLVADVAA